MQTPTQPPQTPQPQQSPEPSWLKRHWKSIGGIAGFVGILANIQPIMGLGETLLETGMTQLAQGDISTPRDNSAVSPKVTFEGKVNQIPGSSSLWLIIYASGIDKYYPYEVDPELEKGTWKYPAIEIGLESDYKKPFKADLVLLNGKDSKQFRKKVQQKIRQTEKGILKERGMENKPDGKTLATVEITRAPR